MAVSKENFSKVAEYLLIDYYQGEFHRSQDLFELLDIARNFPKWHFNLCRLKVQKNHRGRWAEYTIPFDWIDLQEWIKENEKTRRET